jgi:hypothetical protein
MRKRLPLQCRLFLLAPIALLVVACVQGDFSIALPGEWQLMRSASGEYAVFKTEPNSNEMKILIGPTVDRYQVLGAVITGHVSPWHGPNAPERPMPGYFVVDTATDRVWQGLDERAWRQRLREFGVTEEPQLKWPTRHDRQYG